ncbi:MAG: S53 family peptidase, partial [Tumebacillaceae bacterium]
MKKSTIFIPAMLSVFSLVLLPVNSTIASPVIASNPNAKIKLAGNEHVAASKGTLKSHKNAADKVTVELSLNLKNQAQLDSFIADLYNPASPNYKHFLTPDQFNAKFAPSAADVKQVTDFAKANGLTVEKVNPNNTLVTVSGTAAQMESAFGVTLNNYTDAKGQSYFANAENPSIPSALSGVINGVTGLDNQAKFHTNAKQKPAAPTKQDLAGKPNLVNPKVGSGPSGGYTPTELRSAYDVTPLNTAGTTGTGQSVALVEFDGYVQSNITTYYNQYGLGSPTPTKVLVDSYNGAAGQGQGEVELDIEVINAIAPKAQVVVYEAPNSDQGELDMYQRIANDNTSKTVSISWGECETAANSSTMNSLHNILSQMATQGQSVYAASGDSGAYDCGTTALAVDNPANDPYVTGVGGTNLTLSGGAYSSEKVWSNSSNKSGGGGGLSTVYAKPSWQTGTGTTNSYSNGKRQVPDVSADADPATGYSIYSAGSWVVYGGTSCAAPLWAGITALNNQYAAANSKGNLGQANPTLYKMFNTAQTYTAYHDITSGTNLYYPATAGYDQATGIGTPDAYNLIRDINGSGGGGGGGTTEKLVNGGFESGNASWTESSSGGYEIVDTTKPHTGVNGAYLVGYNSGNDQIWQTVTIPSTATTATLSFWTYVSTTETSHPYDYFYAKPSWQTGTGTTNSYSNGKRQVPDVSADADPAT